MSNKVQWKFTRQWRPVVCGEKQYVGAPSAFVTDSNLYRVPANDYTLKRMSGTISVTTNEDGNDGQWDTSAADNAIQWDQYCGFDLKTIPGIPIDIPMEEVLTEPGKSQAKKQQPPWRVDDMERKRITEKVLRLLPSRKPGFTMAIKCFYHNDSHPSATITVWQKTVGRPYVFYKCRASSCLKSTDVDAVNPLILDDEFVTLVSAANLGV
jgi:hypothetical protein